MYDIRKVKKTLTDYDLYILGCWVDKATVNKNMQKFIAEQKIEKKKVALFMTCGLPNYHYHAKDSIDNYLKYMQEKDNEILTTFICQGKIDPKILIVFKFLTWREPNFIHKIDQPML
ncbi:flavodoxin family protein [Gemella sp. zg-570]|uniref:flavodoxin family protein n=1 Tax=unclassified Gemella TaxID=2624949 RepID=UPI002110FAAD|nr:flavodoxin family protein [Gemella sp. zg-570]